LRAETTDSFRAAVREIETVCNSIKQDGIRLELIHEGSVVPLEESTESLALLDEYAASGKKVGVEFSRLPFVSGGISNANDIAVVGIPCIDGLGPYGEGAHTKEEFLYLPSFIPRAKAFTTWYLDLCRRRRFR
jgi:glutamate carboxypeptidase